MLLFQSLLASRFISYSVLIYLVLIAASRCKAQSAQQMVKAACAHEISQLSSSSLWESTSKEYSSGHIYIERRIETVDGDINKLVSIDGRSPSGPEERRNEEKLRELLRSAPARERMHSSNINEKKDVDDLLRMVPRMFRFIDRGGRNEVEVISFSPKPSFHPQSFKQRAVHAMSGTLYIDRKSMRLEGIDAVVSEQVEFGYGILGTLNKGGTYTLRRVEVRPGQWKTRSAGVNLNGRIALFKNVGRKGEEIDSNWQPIPSGTTVLEALAMQGLRP